MREVRTGRAADVVLSWLPWGIFAAAVVVGFIVEGPAAERVSPVHQLIWSGVFFAALLVRVLRSIRTSPGRTSVLLALFIGVLLWLLGSASLSTSEAGATVSFPGPGEWLFLAAYLGLAAFVFLDGQPSTALRSATAWADAAIVCGGAAAVSAAVVLTPLSRAYPDSGVALLVALIYPTLDLALALMVIAQWALGARPGSWRTILMVVGFALLLLADVSLLVGVPSGIYASTYVADVLWAAAFGVLVQAACMRDHGHGSASPRHVPRWLLVTGFGVALLLLAVRPSGLVGAVIAASSAVVLAAAGWRLLLALGASRSASDALRLSAVDDLTGLPNRRALLRRVDDVIAHRGRAGLLLIDVDHFHEINDGLGHDTGDYVLRVLAGRISEVLPQGALLARGGGDEFSVLVVTDDPIVLTQLAQAIRSVAAQAVGADGVSLTVRLSIGIAWLQPDDVVPTDLLRRADVAQRSARHSGESVEVYRPETDQFSRAQLELAHDLRTAVLAGHLQVWYQPVVRASDGAVQSVEALVHWEHPTEGLVMPGRLYALARREGLTLELSEHVATQAITDLRDWRRAGLALGVSINVAPAELLEGVLAARLIRQIDDAGIDPAAVTLEVTEDSFRWEPDHARRALIEVGAAGLRTSIDGYGSGFSSLSYLRDLPVAEVKLDRTFFASVVSDPRSAVIVSSTVAMAHALGMSVVAEGVESEYVASRAIVLGVDSLQGLFLSPPLASSDVAAFVQQVAIS